MTDDLPDSLTITLRKPVEFAGTAYTEIVLREPTAGEMVEIDKLSGRTADVFAISLISGVPKGAVERIGARDFMKGVRFISAFFVDAPQTGAPA